MPITFPRLIPSFIKAVDASLLPIDINFKNRSWSRGVSTVQLTESYWELDWTTQPLTRVQKSEFEVWLQSLRGGQLAFLGYQPFRTFPAAYQSNAHVLGLLRAGGGAFDGTFPVTVVDATTLAGSNLPSGFVLSAGDFISVLQNGRLALFRVTVTAQATAGGVISAIEVEMPIPTNLFTGGVADVVQASAEFLLENDEAAGSRFRVVADGVKFRARSRVQA